MVSLKIVKESVDNGQIVRLSGRLDAATSSKLDQELAAMFSKDQKRFLIDFTKIDYLSSAGMRVLLAWTKKLKGMDGIFALCCISDEVMDIIKMAGFERILSIYENEKKAREEAFQG